MLRGAAFGRIMGRQPRRRPGACATFGLKHTGIRLCRANQELLHAAHRRNPLYPRLPRLAGDCLQFNRSVLSLLDADHHIRVVILAAAWAAPLYRNWMDGWLSVDPVREPQVPSLEASRRLYIESLTGTIRSLEDAGKQVIVLEDTPTSTSTPY